MVLRSLAWHWLAWWTEPYTAFVDWQLHSRAVTQSPLSYWMSAVIHWTRPTITWMHHTGSWFVLISQIVRHIVIYFYNIEYENDCGTKTCFSLKFNLILRCKSLFYSWYFGFAVCEGIYHKCHIPLCHWLVTLSHITRNSAMDRDIIFPEKSISIKYKHWWKPRVCTFHIT